MSWARVLSYPPRHPYVDRLHGRTARLVHRDEVMPSMPRYLDPSWVRDCAMDWDIAHFHLARFGPGQEDVTAQRIARVVRAHHRAGVSVVFTVHDLSLGDGPQDDDLTHLLRIVDPMVSAVLTLTRGCADVLQDLLGRPVRVIPHGPLLDPSERHRLRSFRRLLSPDEQPMLLHAGSLEPRLGLDETIEAVSASRTGVRLRILVDPAKADEVRRRIDGKPWLSVESDPDLTRAKLARAMANASALVLPYRWGTHSAMLEMATDIGTPVIATDVGFLREQQPLIPIVVHDGRIDVESFIRALDRPISPTPAVREVDRERDHHALECHHVRLYHRMTLGRMEPLPVLTPAELPLVVPRDNRRSIDLSMESQRVGS